MRSGTSVERALRRVAAWCATGVVAASLVVMIAVAPVAAESAVAAERCASEASVWACDSDDAKVAVIRARVDARALDTADFSRDIDSFIFKNGVYTVQSGPQSDLFHAGLRGVDHVF